MIAVFLGLCLTQTTTLELERGQLYPWCQDTTLDANKPDLNRGGDGILEGGPGRTILIRFAQLRNVVGAGKRVRSAKIVFVLSGPDQPKLRSAARVTASWGEGPIRTLEDIIKPTDGPAARWSATWRHRRAGENAIPWGSPGAGESEKIPGAKLESLTQDTVSIAGLETVVQSHLEREYDNFGFALSFEGKCEFFSANAGIARPKLVLELEDAPQPAGADLSVTLIERTPTYERYDLRSGDIVKDGVPFPGNIPNATGRRWPNDGEEVTYLAHIKNVGTAPASGFSAQWQVREVPGSTENVDKRLTPGEETVLLLKRPFRNVNSDHRVQPVALRISPKGEDVDASNDFLEVQEGGLSVGVWIKGDLGPKLEDWIQAQSRLVNDAFAASRYSFAPDGVKETVRIQAIRSGDIQTDLGLDIELQIDSRTPWLNPSVFVRLAAQLGLPTYKAMSPEPPTLSRRAFDRFPGIAGGGDMRNDAPLPSQINIIQEPVYEPFQSSIKFEPMGLLSATDVASLNSNIGRRRGLRGDVLYDLPEAISLRFLTSDGLPIVDAQVKMYQSKDGQMRNALPIQLFKTNDRGYINLSQRQTGEASNLTTVTGHTLRPNAFGRIDPNGGNGVLLFEVAKHGVVDYAWLKLWQCVDSYHRGNRSFSLFDFRLNLPTSPLEEGNNLAAGKFRGFSDGDLKIPVNTGGDYVDFDLGRDRQIGELRLFGLEGFWDAFEVRVYGTGDKPEAARLWARELDGPWSARNRIDLVEGSASVAYRGRAQRFRFIRLVNKGRAKPEATLTEVRIAAVARE